MSQRARGQPKSTGVCPVCRREIRVQDCGRLHRHGPHDAACPGTNQLPISAALSTPQATGSGPGASQTSSLGQQLHGQSSTASQPSSSGSQSFAVPLPGVSQSTKISDFFNRQASNKPKLLLHIPRSARFTCGSLLASILRSICSNPNSEDRWLELMAFSGSILAKPPRGGRRHNVGNLLKKRVSDFNSSHMASKDTSPSAGRPRTRKSDPEEVLAAAVTSKIEEGNLRAAVRLLCSDEKPADFTQSTYDSLLSKHPVAPADVRLFPGVEGDSYSVEVSDVSHAIRSFPNGSAGGLDWTRPQHLKDLVTGPDANNALLEAITQFVNLLLEGHCPQAVQPYFFGGRLLALAKKDGGVRPIAIGSVWRRLAAKCANVFGTARSRHILEPRQLGVAVKGGAEAAIHAARRFVERMPDDFIFIKLDFSNAFNSLRRDSMLEAVKRDVPEIFNFCRLAYSSPSCLAFGDRWISSQMGPQQGDPLGPLLFSLTLQPLLVSLQSDITLGYLDDVSIGGPTGTVESDLLGFIQGARELGLSLNVNKCEVVGCCTVLPSVFDNFKLVQPNEAILLGSPLFEGPAMTSIIEARCRELQRATERFALITAHDALLILKSCMGACKLLYHLRTSPCAGHPGLDEFDRLIRDALSLITNSTIDDLEWVQASLPVGNGGLGIRSVVLLAPSAFLASAAATSETQISLLPIDFDLTDDHVSRMLVVWQSRYPQTILPSVLGVGGSQQAWDEASISSSLEILNAAASNTHDQARLLACSAPHAGDWLNALPISSCGLRLDNEAIRVAVGLRLGQRLCAPHACPCGAAVDERGAHGLSCKRSLGRAARHGLINDLVARAFERAKIPVMKEPVGLLRSDGKRPDGVTLIPWHTGMRGRCMAWDVTVSDTLAPSYLPVTSRTGGAACELADIRKRQKYLAICATHEFCAVACETLGPINASGLEFLKNLGRLVSKVTGDPRECTFLLQRLSILIQKCNAMAFGGSFLTRDADSDSC